MNAMAGQSCKVLQQILEALHPKTGCSTTGLVLPPGRLRSNSGSDNRFAGGLRRLAIIVLVQNFSKPVTHVPLDVVREHAQEHVSPNAIIVPVIDRSHVKVDRLHTAERSLDGRKALVSFHDLFRLHLCRRHARPHDVQTVECRFGRDVVGASGVRETVSGDGQLEVLLHFVTTDDFADAQANLFLAAQRVLAALRGADDDFEFLFGGCQKCFPFADPFVGQNRVAAHDQTLTRKQVFRRDFRQIAFVEQRPLDVSGVHQLTNSFGAQPMVDCLRR